MAKISGHFETAKRKMLKDVKGFGKVILSMSPEVWTITGVWTKCVL